VIPPHACKCPQLGIWSERRALRLCASQAPGQDKAVQRDLQNGLRALHTKGTSPPPPRPPLPLDSWAPAHPEFWGFQVFGGPSELGYDAYVWGIDPSTRPCRRSRFGEPSLSFPNPPSHRNLRTSCLARTPNPPIPHRSDYHNLITHPPKFTSSSQGSAPSPFVPIPYHTTHPPEYGGFFD